MEVALSLFWGVLTGFAMGLLGGGGALTVIPVLLYVFHLPLRETIGGSLFLVMMTALPVVLLYFLRRYIVISALILLGLSGMIGSSIGSRMSGLIPVEVLIALLVALMLISAYFMLKPTRLEDPLGKLTITRRRRIKLFVVGFGIGLLTGLVGVGGGFMLVPALVLLGRVPTRAAIATSLAIIVINAFFGVLGYWNSLPLGRSFFPFLVAGMILGGFLGYLVSFQLEQAKLKQGFGLLLIGLVILLLVLPPV